jgi:hypothetical protein
LMKIFLNNALPMTVEESSVNSSLPPEVERREQALGKFTACFAQRLPKDLQATAFCGPASFRDPQADDIWHAYIIRRGIVPVLQDQIPLLARALIGGIRRFILARFGKFTFFPRDGARVIGVGPVNICKTKNGSVETDYCHPEDTKAMSWLVFDDMKRDPEGYPLSRFVILSTYLKMLFCWVIVSFSCRGNDSPLEWRVGSLLTLRWILSFVWANKWMLSLELRHIFKNSRPEEVFCVHEMHPHSRIAWAEARRFDIPTVTIQHASIVRAKLWYFPTREELAAGLATPHKMAVYSKEVQKLFESIFPGKTLYPLACGPRFSKWQRIRSTDHRQIDEKGPILFAGSLPWWDNVVVLKGVQRLLTEGDQKRPIVVRLHPVGRIPVKWEKWLAQTAESGKVHLSKGSLEDAIGESAVVVGMNTTVLEEAALMGKAVLVLEERDYLSFATRLGTHIPLNRFFWREVEKAIAYNIHSPEGNVRAGRALLGIDHPVFRIDQAH